MAGLGAPQTGKFMIGTFEVRVGPQNMAGKLTQAHSVGVIDGFTLNMDQQTAELRTGFPQELADTAVTTQVTNLSAQIREYSARNMNLLMGNGILTATTNVYGGFVQTGVNHSDTAAAGGATSITLGSSAVAVADFYVGATITITGGTGNGQSKTITEYTSGKVATVSAWTTAPDATSTYTVTLGTTATELYLPGETSVRLKNDSYTPAVNDVLTIYNTASPAEVHVSVVTAVSTSSGISTVTIEPALPFTIYQDALGDTYSAFQSEALAFGRQSAVNYFSVSLVQVDRATSRPIVLDFWKAALDGGLNLSGSPTDFGTTELRFKFLEPTAAEYVSTYSHVDDEFTKFPVFRWAAVADVV